MSTRFLPRLLFFALLCTAAVHIAFFYPLLPATVASHFDADGLPNGWCGKTSLALVYSATVGLFAVIGLSMHHLIRRTPARFISLPHRDYWLAEEQREATLAYLGRHMIWFSNGSMAFIMSLMHAVFRANLQEAPRLAIGAFWPGPAYLAFIVVWAVALFLRFRKPC
jgi:uncharacterized membrane protein